MGFDKNEAKKASVKRIGIHTIIPLVINPNADELKKYFNLTGDIDEPVYTKEVVDTKTNEEYLQTQIKLVFKTEEDPKYIDSISIFLDSRNRFSKTGKYQYINKQGQTTWTFDDEAAKEGEGRPDWIDFESFRKAHTGEETIINMIKASRNIGGSGEAFFDDINRIFKGDVSEIRASLIDVDDVTKKPLGFKVLLGIDGKYIRFYDKVFLTKNEFDITRLTKSLNKDKEAGYDFKANYTIKPQEYDPMAFTGDAVPAAGSSTVGDDDLPF